MRPRGFVVVVGATALVTALSLPGGALATSGLMRSTLPGRWQRAGRTRPTEIPPPSEARARSTIECVTAPSEAENITLDCPAEYAFPTREPTIAVDPTDPRHMVAAAIDGPFDDQTIEFSTSFDGGETWTIGDLPHGPHLSNFDPWVTFDVKHGVVILSFQSIAPKEPLYCPPSGAQLVTISADGGLTWGNPVTVQKHRGCTGNVLWLGEAKTATDNDPASPYYGRTWLTGPWLKCNSDGCSQSTGETQSDDGGGSWTKVQIISGSNAEFCTASPYPPKCDNDFAPMLPVISPDWSVYVAFANEQHEAAWEPGEYGEDQIMIVRSTDGGETWSPPDHIVDLENGSRDYDCSEGHYGCRLSGIGLFPFPAGNNLLTVGLDGTLYLAFSDNRDGRHDVEHPVSNSDVFLMTSTDGGQTWTGPDVASDAPGDQWKPALSVSPVTGELGVVFYDRGEAPGGKTVNVTLATGLPGHFELETITTAPSHLSNDLWLSENLSDCHRCVYHVGEYIGLAYGSDGAANMTWTDLRHLVTLPNGRKGFTMNIDYAREEMDAP
jgi:hypothetical protein